MKKLFVIFLLLPVLASAQIAQRCPQFTPYGTGPAYQAQPGDQEICKANYAVIHRCSVKAPVAVFEHLTVQSMTGQSKRRDNFRPDPEVHEQCRATLQDYAVVGRTHDRGHLSPAANNTQNDQTMSDSFYLSNMIAQVANNNRGIWKQLETWERDWAMKGGDFYIVSGGIFAAGYQTVGNGLGIPTHIYKIIYEKNSRQLMAWLMPNAALPVADLPKYQVPLSTVEQATGMRFNFGQ